VYEKIMDALDDMHLKSLIAAREGEAEIAVNIDEL